MCSISKLTFTRFNFFKFPLILQNASAIRNQRYMKTPVETQRGQGGLQWQVTTQSDHLRFKPFSRVVYDQDSQAWFACCNYYYNCIIYHPPALEINDSKLQSTFFVHCPNVANISKQPFYWMNKLHQPVIHHLKMPP